MTQVNYSFVPAAVEYRSHGGLAAYVRHHNRGDREITVEQWDPNVVKLRCPDRDLLLLKDQHMTRASVPRGEEWDSLESFNILDPLLARENGVNWVMLNFHAHLEQKLTVGMRKNGTPPIRVVDGRTVDLQIMADSGGFQIATGAADFVDPRDLIKWYNENVDCGMVLDIPLPHTVSIEDSNRAARVQKMSTDFFLSEAREDLRFINVLHGGSLEARMRYWDIVHDDRIKALAFAGYKDNPVAMASQLYKLAYQAYDRGYRHIHTLGVFNLGMQASILWIARMFRDAGKADMVFTSDASTHLMSGKNKIFHTQLGMDWAPKRMLIGDRNRFPTITSQLHCQCPVCRVLKYEDVMNVLDNALIRFLLSTHNLFEIVRYCNQLVDVCSTTNPTIFKSFVDRHLKGNLSQKATIDALSYLGMIETHGIKEADRKYNWYLNTGFKAAQIVTLLEGEEEEEVVDDIHALKVVDGYETWYKSEGKALVKTKLDKVQKLNGGRVLKQKAGLKNASAKRKLAAKAADAKRQKDAARASAKAGASKSPQPSAGSQGA